MSNEIRALMASLSPNAEKLFKALKQAGYLSEDKTVNAEKATALSKLPKAQCMNALQELEKGGYVKKKKNNMAVSYFLAKTDIE
jgi:Fic family protein